MTLEEGCEVINQCSMLEDIFITINGIDININIEQNLMNVCIKKDICKDKHLIEVRDFIFEKLVEEIKKVLTPIQFKKFYINQPILSCGKDFFVLTYHFSTIKTVNEVRNTLFLFDPLIEALYYAVEAAVVEYNYAIEDAEQYHEIPNEIYWELETYNDECYENEIEEDIVSPDNLVIYRLNKKSLFSISLGYYPIDLTNLETDFVPELLGVVLDVVQDFCYVTSYEDEDYIYIYTPRELTDDDKFDIYEKLFDLGQYIVPDHFIKIDGTLEEYFSQIKR